MGLRSAVELVLYRPASQIKLFYLVQGKRVRLCHGGDTRRGSEKVGLPRGASIPALSC